MALKKPTAPEERSLKQSQLADGSVPKTARIVKADGRSRISHRRAVGRWVVHSPAVGVSERANDSISRRNFTAGRKT
jgi:hypothetical protein